MEVTFEHQNMKFISEVEGDHIHLPHKVEYEMDYGRIVFELPDLRVVSLMFAPSFGLLIVDLTEQDFKTIRNNIRVAFDEVVGLMEDEIDEAVDC